MRINQCDIHKTIRLWLLSSYCGKAIYYLRIHVYETLETYHWSVFRNFDSFLLRNTGFWELNLQHLEKHWCLKIINIKLWNSSTLTVLSCDSCWQCKYEPTLYSNNKRMSYCNISFKAKFISCHTKVQMLHVYPIFVLLCCSLLFSWFPTSNTDRQQSRYSEVSDLNYRCNIFVFLRHKHLNYTCRMQFIFCNSFLQRLLCRRIQEYKN